MTYTQVMNKIPTVTIMFFSCYSDIYMNITLLYMTPLHFLIVYCDAVVTDSYTCKHHQNTRSLSW